MSTVTRTMRQAATHASMRDLGLMERLSIATAQVASIDEVEDLALVLHRTSCSRADDDSHAAHDCRDFRSRRFHRWAWEMLGCIRDAVDSASAPPLDPATIQPIQPIRPIQG